MDYSKAYSTPPPSTTHQSGLILTREFETTRKEILELPEKIWLNKCCPKCKSTEFTAITEDCGSQMWCVCGHHYIRFTWAK